MQQNTARIAEPLHIQRLEAALDMGPFMEYAKQVLSQALSSDDEDDNQPGTSTSGVTGKKRASLMGSKEERQSVKTHLYNFQDLTADREWLYDVILSDTDSASEISDEDEYIKDMLKAHIRQQKHRENFYKKTTNTQYAYYGAGLLATHDMFPEHQQSIVGIRKRKRRIRREKPLKLTKPLKPLKIPKPPKIRKARKQKLLPEAPEPGEVDPADLKNYAFGDTVVENDDDDDDFSVDDTDTATEIGAAGSQPQQSGRGRRRKQFSRTPEALAARRRRVWQLMAKKELGRYQRSKANNHKEMLLNCKRMASMCSKVVRQRAMYSQKVMKEVQWRAKRLSREMLGYWKRYERVERDNRRRLEKEAEEQRKMDVELIEAKRQQRKLNFLITQTELYAHFMSKKLGQGTEEEQLRILNQLDEEANPRLAAYDDYDAEKMKLLAQQHVESAVDTERVKRGQFVVSTNEQVKQESIEIDELMIKDEPIEETEEETVAEKRDPKADLPQPKLFQGTLKAYQIKGMTWLANLYDQGISGILADEMGLGKTVQSIAFLCHIAEHYGVWGPFLIVSPASTLHNWQQEMKRFMPDFNVVPYWGSPNERRILRTFWEQKDLHTRGASFHVVITSYQLIVSDYKFFNRIKWQYMILDEAQAIKSSSSNRWKMLLGFNCRNRLLLSGTPIQNSMAELWALLHFIMPTLFDSHEEFNEWFSKDIESHAENKTGIDEKQISRLHMILKPFMLRRIKKDVENELSDKIEIMVYCPLTIRQKLLYMALKQKIRIEDLLNLTRGGVGSSSSDGHHVDKNFTSNLMNLVMQFRKVCNHPELFERRDARSPFGMRCQEYVLPRLVFDDGLLYRAMPSKRHLLYNRFSIFKAAHMQRCLFGELKSSGKLKDNVTYPRYIDLSCTNDCGFSFMRFCDLSLKDMEDVTINGLITHLLHYRRFLQTQALLAYRRQWWRDYYQPACFQLLEPTFENPLLKCGLSEDSVMRELLFTGMTANESTFYAFGDFKLHFTHETIEHRVIRSRNFQPTANKADLIEEIKTEEDSTPTPSTIKSESNMEDMDDDSMSSSTKIIAKNSHNNDKHTNLAPKFPHINRMPQKFECEALNMPRFLYGLGPRVQAVKKRLYCESRAAEWSHVRHTHCENNEGLELLTSGLGLCRPQCGWSSIIIPDKQTLVSDAGKLAVLDNLLTRLKAQGHRVLIYSQMTKMIDLLEEFMWFRKHRYMRLDGSSKISARRDMVADFQTRQDIFVFLLSTRAGGLGINLTAADTVIFYDSDWNPTVDQQAMDRAHRLGQTKQVTVYRLICKGTIEERILQRAREKSEIQRMVISGGNFKPDSLKPKEVVSLLLDDEEIEMKYRQRAEPISSTLTPTQAKEISTATATAAGERKRRKLQKQSSTAPAISGGTTIAHPFDADSIASAAAKRSKFELSQSQLDDDSLDVTTAYTSAASSPSTTTTGAANNSETFVPGATSVFAGNDDSDNEAQLIVDCESSEQSSSLAIFDDFNSIAPIRRRHHPRGTRRGRPRGSGRRAGGHGSLGRAFDASASTSSMPTTSICGDDDLPSTSQAAAAIAALSDSFAPSIVPPATVKRGPGRPRLKTDGPVHRGTRGSRGAPRARKPIGPLVVPLGRSPAATPLNRSPVASPAHAGSGSASGMLMTSTPTSTPPKRQLSMGNEAGVGDAN